MNKPLEIHYPEEFYDQDTYAAKLTQKIKEIAADEAIKTVKESTIGARGSTSS